MEVTFRFEFAFTNIEPITVVSHRNASNLPACLSILFQPPNNDAKGHCVILVELPGTAPGSRTAVKFAELRSSTPKNSSSASMSVHQGLYWAVFEALPRAGGATRKQTARLHHFLFRGRSWFLLQLRSNRIHLGQLFCNCAKEPMSTLSLPLNILRI